MTAAAAAPALKTLAANLEKAYPGRAKEPDFHDRAGLAFLDEHEPAR